MLGDIVVAAHEWHDYAENVAAELFDGDDMRRWCDVRSEEERRAVYPACPLLEAADKMKTKLGVDSPVDVARGRLESMVEALGATSNDADALKTQMSALLASEDAWWSYESGVEDGSAVAGEASTPHAPRIRYATWLPPQSELLAEFEETIERLEEGEREEKEREERAKKEREEKEKNQ